MYPFPSRPTAGTPGPWARSLAELSKFLALDIRRRDFPKENFQKVIDHCWPADSATVIQGITIFLRASTDRALVSVTGHYSF